MEINKYVVENPHLLNNQQVKKLSAKKTKVNEGFATKLKNNSKKIIATLAIIAAIGTVGIVGYNHISNNNNNIDDPKYSVSETYLNSELDFNPNSANEMIERVSNFIIELKKEGYDITYVDGASFYIHANGFTLSEKFISELQLSYLTEEQITKNANKVANYLKEAYMANSKIDITDMFSNKKDADYIDNLLNISLSWDNAKDKGIVAKQFQNFTNDTFNTQKYTEYGPYSNIIVMTLLRGQLEKTINSGYTIIDKKTQDRLWGTELSCFRVDKDGNQILNGDDLYSREYRTVKENITSKLNNANYDYSIKEEDTLGYQILLDIARNVKDSKVKLGTRPDIQAIRDANNIYNKQSVNTNSSSKKNTTSTNSNNVSSTTKPVEKQKEEIQQEIKKEYEEKKEEKKEEENLWQAGHDDGFAAGVSGAAKSISSKNTTYIQGYEYGYKAGYDIFLLTQQTEEKEVEVEYEVEENVYVDPSTGYVYVDGVQQFNQDGTPLVIGGPEENVKIKQK